MSGHDSLRPVTADCLFLVCDLVTRKMSKTVAGYCRKTGVPELTKDQYKTAKVGLVIHKRFMTGDYRASSQELEKLYDCCQLIADLHQETIGLPKKIMGFDWRNLHSGVDVLLPGAYAEVMLQVSQGALEGYGKK